MPALRSAAFLFAASLQCIVLAGQSRAQAPTPDPSVPQVGEPDTSIPEKVQPPMGSDPQSTQNSLSSKLKKSDGVISPPAGVDPKMEKKPDSPAPDDMVIPTPGSPGR